MEEREDFYSVSFFHTYLIPPETEAALKLHLSILLLSQAHVLAPKATDLVQFSAPSLFRHGASKET